MNILLSALICGGIAGFGALLVWLAHKHLGLSEKGQRIGQIGALVIALAVVRVLPIEQLANNVQAQETTQSRADAELLAIPTFKALHDGYPLEYAAMRDTAVESLEAGESKLTTINRIRPRMMEILSQQMIKASDATTSRHLGFIVRQASFLKTTDPQYCHELLNTPGRISFDPTAVFPRPMVDEEMSIMADILRETATLPSVDVAPLNEAKFQPLVETAFAGLSERDVNALTAISFEVANATTADQKSASCSFALALMEQVAKLPPAEGAQIFRALLAEGSKL